jgi:DNA-3-methyladenine glycosylase
LTSRKIVQPARWASSPRGKESGQRLILAHDYFARPALVVARELIGKFLVRQGDQGEVASLISETEAYVGPHDLACHASKGCTARTQVMFGPAGFWYVYLIYGIHWMLNVVTDTQDYPSAVLIRGVGDWDGPGKLTKGLAIDKRLNGQPASPDGGLWIEDRGYRPPRHRVRRTPRIGVEYSGEWANKPYRFVLSPLPKVESRSTATQPHRRQAN